MIRQTLAAAAALSMLFATAAQAASPEAAYTLQISGFVPTVCNANLSASQVTSQTGSVSLGQMSVFCNDANGYQVWIDYSPTLAGDTLQVGSQTITLTSSGSALVDQSNAPNISSQSVTLNLPLNRVSGFVSVGVVPL